MDDIPNSGEPPQSPSDRASVAWQQLQLILSFFSRIDTKLSVVLGINLGMLALLGTRLPDPDQIAPIIAALGTLFLIGVCVSLRHLWTGAFPDLAGATHSLVYFKTISAMTKEAFQAACRVRTVEDLTNDLLEQCWWNSKILACKFHSLRHAYVATLASVAPWLVLIYLLPKR